jgi:hypothetical protein
MKNLLITTAALVALGTTAFAGTVDRTNCVSASNPGLFVSGVTVDLNGVGLFCVPVGTNGLTREIMWGSEDGSTVEDWAEATYGESFNAKLYYGFDKDTNDGGGSGW